MSLAKLLSVAAIAAFVPALAAPTSQDSSSNCFPFNQVSFPTDGTAPNVTLDQWWCSQSMQYGFLGFSYPLEDDDCSASSNSYAQMNKDFAQMKADFGASIVRMYYPTCVDKSVFQNAMRAARDNGMGLIVQVWTNFGVDTVWKQSQQAIYDAISDPAYSAWAAFVVHWADFGSEPIGDGMDGGGQQFVTDLGKFRLMLNQRGILVGISEDWNRPGSMSSNDGKTLGPIGSGVNNNSDYLHIHPMPYYHSNGPESGAWSYIQQQVNWAIQQTGKSVWITETQWAWGFSDHYPGHVDVGVTQYTNFWKTFDDNCEWFKSVNVGWFLHDWKGEETFDIINPNDGSYIIQNWRPRRC